MGQVTIPPAPGLTYKREVFLTSGTFTLPITGQNKFDAILVSGGSGGGRGRYSGAEHWGTGGTGGVLYVTNVFCTNGTTLTITVGAGGAGAVSPNLYASGGTVSTIAGIAGNGVSTSISSPFTKAGQAINFNYTSAYNNSLSDVVSWGIAGGGRYGNKNSQVGSGFGLISKSQGADDSGQSTSLFNFTQRLYTGSSANRVLFGATGTGGPIPLVGNLLHAPVGGTGTTGTAAGSGSTANTFFAGSGGSSTNSITRVGTGGGGGAGGPSTVGGTLGGNGGNGSANSGGGGGAGGKNNSNLANSGTGGTGGSGFVIIGYWG